MTNWLDWSYCAQKVESNKEDSLNEKSNPIFWENMENISKCCLLKFLTSMLNFKKKKKKNVFNVCNDEQ